MEAPASSSRRSILLGGAAGVAMPVIFTLLGFLQTTLTPSYSMIAQPVNSIGSFLAFLPAAIGFILTARPMFKSPAWRSYAPLALGTGILMIVIFFAFGALAEAKDTPLHPREGLFQRVLGNLWLICTFILGLRLMRLGRGPRDWSRLRRASRWWTQTLGPA